MVRIDQLSASRGEAPERVWLRELAAKCSRAAGRLAGRGVVLCETRLRASELASDSLRALTYADAAVEILAELSGAALPRRISSLEADLLVYTLLQERPTLGVLRAEVISSDESVALGLRAARGIRSTLDAIRLELRGERILSQILDEYGEVSSESERFAELLQLESIYTEALREQQLADTPGLLELLAERLRAASKGDLAPQLPPVIVLDQPTHLFALEREIWGRMAQISELYLLLDSEAAAHCEAEVRPTSLRQLKSVFDFVREWGSQLTAIVAIPADSPENVALVSRVIDGAEVTVDGASCSLALCEERGDEAAALALCVQSLLEAQRAERIHLATPDVEPYRELLREHFAALAIPLHISKATPFAETAAGDLLSVLLDWIEDPTLDSFEGLLTHQFAKSRRISAAEINALAQEFGVAFQVDPGSSVVVRPPLLVTELRAGGAPESLLDFEDWQARVARQLLQSAGKDPAPVVATLAGLVLLREQIALRAPLAGRARGDVRLLSSYYRRMRYRLRELRGEPLGEVIASLRQVGPIMREAGRGLQLLEPGALAATTVVRDLLQQANAPARANEGVLVTELLDVRGLRGKTTILFGLTAAAFPAKIAAEPVFAPASEAIGLQLLRRSGAGARTFESLWLLAHALRASERVVIFAPCSDESGDMPVPHLLRTLGEVVGEARFHGVFPQQESSPELGQRELLVKKRATALRSEFEGDLSGQSWCDLWPMMTERFDDGDTTLYTVSELELFHDCPHRFYFSSVLGLDEAPMGFEARLRSEVGSIVHRSLERFVRSGGMSRESLSGDFTGACRRLAAIAEEVVRESAVDWESEAVTRDMKREVVGGLVDGARRGYLRAALEIQRELLSDLEPDRQLAEYRFNRPFSPSERHSRLRIAHELGAMEVRGVIDRIDRDREGQLHSVWDYKTGSSPSRADVVEGRALQVPIYALALQQNFDALPKAGGVLDLRRPDRRLPSEAQGEPAKVADGFVREQLMLRKAGRSYALDPAAVVENVARTRTTISELDKRFRQGDFSQKASTTGCEYCGFRGVCARDEAKLERGVVAEVLRAPQAVLPRYRANASIGIEISEKVPEVREQQAASVTTHDIALLAGAGSGKTHVLRTRVLGLLRGGEPIESILAITFTEKAAGEIRERLELAISEVLLRGEFEGSPLDNQQRERLREAQSRFSEALFGTIHSLAGKIVRMDPALAGYAEGIEVATKSVIGALVSRAVTEVVFERGVTPIEIQGAVEELLQRGVSRFRLKSELQGVLNDRRKVALLERLADPANESMRREMLARVEVIRSQRLVELVGRIPREIGAWLAGVSNWLLLPEGLKKTEEHKRPLFEQAVAYARDLERTFLRATGGEDGCHGELLRAVGTARDFLLANGSASVSKRGEHPNYWNQLRDSLERVGKQLVILAPDSGLDQRAMELAVRFGQVALAASERFTKLKRERGVVDFDDLIVGAARMLSDQTERGSVIRRRLQARFRHLMIDEFQDTDPEQWAIVRAIAEVNDDLPRSLFVVGDMQQSIYSFRGGDVRVFNDAIKFIAARQGQALTLRNNYRSDPEVVEWVNRCFDAIFAMDFDSAGNARVSSAVRAQQMIPSRAGSVGPCVAAVHTVSGRAEASADKQTQEEQVARFIQGVLAASEGTELAAEFQQFRRLKGRSGGPKIAVLARRAKDLHRVAAALDSAGVPFSLSHSEEYFALDEVRMFENLLSALADPWDSVALVGTLRSPLVGLSDLDLVELRAALGKRWEGFWRPTDQEQPGRFDAIRNQLRRWRARARHEITSALLTDIAEELRLDALYERTGNSDAVLNIQRLFAMIREAVRGGELGTSAAETVRWLRLQRASGGRKPNANSGSHPVVLMTIHASKGLEFPMVVLPFLDWTPNRLNDFVFGELPAVGDTPAAPAVGVKVLEEEGCGERRAAFLQTLLREGEAAMTLAEERRVFYVACTRSRDFLAICGAKLKLPGANISQHGSEAKTKNDRKSEGEINSAQGPLKWLAAIVDGGAEAD